MTPNDATEVVPYLTSAATIVYLQKWLKSRSVYQQFVTAFPLADKYVQWLVAGCMSVAAAAGIHYTWTGDLTNGGVFTLAIPSAVAMLHGLSDVFKVYILQHTIYSSQATKIEVLDEAQKLNAALHPQPKP